jgi:hypothetical protein
MVGGGADTSAVSGLCDHPVSTEVPLVIDESTPFRDVLVSFSRSLRVISDQAGHYDLVTSQGRGSQRYDAVDRLICPNHQTACACAKILQSLRLCEIWLSLQTEPNSDRNRGSGQECSVGVVYRHGLVRCVLRRAV